MHEIKEYLKQHEDIHSIISGVDSGLKEQLIAGLSGSARSMFTSLIQESTNKKTLLVTHQLAQAQQLYDDLLESHDKSDIYLYPVNELLASELAVASPELMSQRISSLSSWIASEDGILIVPIAALKRRLPPLTYWSDYQLH